MSSKKHRKKKGLPPRNSSPLVESEGCFFRLKEKEAGKRNFFGRYSFFFILGIIILVYFVHLYVADYQHRGRQTTMDEMVYTRLGFQLKNGEGYNTLQIYEEYLKAGHKLPTDFSRPLFKHPPFFSFLVSLSYTFQKKKASYPFQELYASASKVSNIMGCLLILLVFLIGGKSYDDSRVGFLAALLLVFDVNYLNCSQKVWMETTLAVMIWLSLYLLYKSMDQKWYFPLAGITVGLALLTKYTAVIVFPAVLTYAALYRRHVFHQYHFYIFLFVSILMFFPWIYANIHQYGGWRSLPEIFSRHGWVFNQIAPFIKVFVAVSIMIMATMILKSRCSFLREPMEKVASFIPGVFSGISCLVLVYLLIQSDFRQSLIKSFSWSGFPRSGWEMYMFNQEPRYFYFKQFLEYSPFYIFFFMALVVAPVKKQADKFLFITSAWMLVFASLWGSYQGRYILYLTPAAMLMTASILVLIWDRLMSINSFKWKMTGVSIYVLMIGYFLVKTGRVDYFHAINNNVAYY